MGSTSKECLELSFPTWKMSGWFSSWDGCSSFSLRGENKARVSVLGLIQSMCHLWGHPCTMSGRLEVSKQLSSNSAGYSRSTSSSLLRKENLSLLFLLFSHLLCCREASSLCPRTPRKGPTHASSIHAFSTSYVQGSAFDAVDHVFLLESFLPWISSTTLLSPDRLLLSVSSQLSSWPSFPLLACQMLAFPEFSPPSFSFLILYALPGNVLEQCC